MPSVRTIINQNLVESFTTYFLSERRIEGSWSHPTVDTLVFAEHSLPGFSVSNHGGPVGSGMPVELLFWGSWWTTAEGAARQNLYSTRVQQVLASTYFAELVQYGIAKPHWRGARVVLQPGPPMSFTSNDDVQAVPDLIDDLIDDDVYPDPDDEKIAFVVFMPKGFTQSINANGSHTKDYDYEFPFDKDWYWVAWVRAFEDAGTDTQEMAIRTFSHELVEMLSDPELDAWYAGQPQTGEIGDAGADKDGTKQAAWVNGAMVQAYWSNQFGATVIPIDRDYRARLVGTVKLDRRDEIHGTFVPDAQESRLCELLPQCCIAERDYPYTVTFRDETFKLHVETERYREPTIAWTVAGTPVTSSGMLSLSVGAGTFNGHKAVFDTRTVNVLATLVGNELTLRTVGTQANFDLTVRASITDASIKGKVKTNVIATPAFDVGFVGAELTVDPEYGRQKAECEKAAIKMFKKANMRKFQPRRIGDPIEFGPAVLSSVPAYARLHQYERARRAVEFSQMAYAVLPSDVAAALTSSLLADVPALQGAIAMQARTHPEATSC